MNAEVLLQHFDRISNAPDAVPYFRQFILDLAVRGELVPQDEEEGTGLELLSHIKRAKATLVEDRRIRGEQRVETADTEDFFMLPGSWTFAQISEVALVQGGKRLPNGATFSTGPTEHIYIRVTDMKNGTIINDDVRYISPAVHRLISRYTINGEDLYITIAGTIGQVGTVPPFFDGHNLTENAAKIVFRGMNKEYLRIALSSDLLQAQFREKTNQLAQPKLALKRILGAIFPIPPLAEQHRIVAKVEELMALCNRLEEAQKIREFRQDKLTAATLHSLNSKGDEEVNRQNARFFINCLPRLTARQDEINLLRQTALDLAVHGRIVRQDPSDEPSSALIDRIKRTKLTLIARGEIKKDKEHWDGLASEPPRCIPKEWTWVRLQDVFEISRGGSPRPAGDPRYFGGHVPWITVGEITKDSQKYLTATQSGLTDDGAARSRFINPGDLLLTNSGATLGVPKISQIRACINDGVAVLRLFHNEPINDFAYLYLQSQTEAFRKINQGMGQPNLNTPIIAGWHFPVPPLAEQVRIARKLEHLMHMCDQLNDSLTKSTGYSAALLESVLQSAIEA